MLLTDTKCCLLKCVALIGYLVTEVSEESDASRGPKDEAAYSQTLAPTEGTTRYFGTYRRHYTVHWHLPKALHSTHLRRQHYS